MAHPDATRYHVVVPARYGSMRLPGKPLLPLLGKPMIEWVYQRVRRSGARQIIIATDDDRVLQVARSFGATAMMTAGTHGSGTDRIAEVARRQRWADSDVVVNVQGDEPLMPETLMEQVAELLAEFPDADIATLATPLESAEALQEGLESYAGTVLAATHDRWFARSFDRFLVFGADGVVYESPEPVWDETRVARPR